MTASKPLAMGTVGLGGYAGGIASVLQQISNPEHPAVVRAGAHDCVKFVAACEPDQVTHAEKIAELKAKGIPVYASFDELLQSPIEGVWIPLPIDLHRPFTEKALAAGKAVICEKPAAGCIDDVDAMIAARDKYKLPTLIGFQDVYDPVTPPSKRAILDGQIGKISHATVHACWPRGSVYYNRSNWAAKFKRGGTWVMDSPANNALAHYVNIALFLLGETMETSAQPVKVEAELYRANPIENYDTCALRLTLDTGATLLVLFTHACDTTAHPVIQLHGSKGSLIRNNESSTIRDASGNVLLAMQRGGDTRMDALKAFAKLVRANQAGEPAKLDSLVATLEVARAHAVAVCGASEASAIHTIGSEHFKETTADGNTLRAVHGINELWEQCIACNQLPHETGLAKWTKIAGVKDLRGYKHFAGPKV